jgi:hypothetical protein
MIGLRWIPSSSYLKSKYKSSRVSGNVSQIQRSSRTESVSQITNTFHTLSSYPQPNTLPGSSEEMECVPDPIPSQSHGPKPSSPLLQTPKAKLRVRTEGKKSFFSWAAENKMHVSDDEAQDTTHITYSLTGQTQRRAQLAPHSTTSVSRIQFRSKPVHHSGKAPVCQREGRQPQPSPEELENLSSARAASKV